MDLKQPRKVIVANSVGENNCGQKLVHFPSRWSFTLPPGECFTYYPYELAYTSALLKRETNHRVKMVDGNRLKWNTSRYIEELSKEAPEVLIMETATPIYAYDLAVARALKDKFGTVLIFTGQHASAFAEQVRGDGVDFVCQGEYEATCVDILRGTDPSQIAGIYPNPPRPLIDLEWLPFPEDDDISRLDYAFPPIECCEYREVELFASRGCIFDCNFCIARHLYYGQKNFRARRIESIIEEIKYLRNKYPTLEGIWFDEELHNGKKQFVLDLCRAISDHKLNDMKFEAMCGHWTLDREVLTAMKNAGYYKVRLGIESVSDDVLEGMAKPIDLRRVERLFRDAKDIGIKLYCTFTVGAVGSTREEDLKTLRFIEKSVADGYIWDLQVSINTPLPGSPFYELAKQKGWLVTEDYGRYDGALSAVISYPDYRADEICAVNDLAQTLVKNTYIRRSIAHRGPMGAVLYSIRRRGLGKTLKDGVAFLGRLGREKFKPLLPPSSS